MGNTIKIPAKMFKNIFAKQINKIFPYIEK
jgi:hypothetical protein